MKTGLQLLLLSTASIGLSNAFLPVTPISSSSKNYAWFLSAEGGGSGAETQKEAKLVSGEQLEMMLTEWDQPLVVDAYATWCGPCLLMAPEFEAAAQELKGKVRFAKIDTDKDELMAARLNIMGLPTLLFLDKFEPKGDEPISEEEKGAKAVLKGRIEGALRKDNIIDLCNYYFFEGPEPRL